MSNTLSIFYTSSVIILNGNSWSELPFSLSSNCCIQCCWRLVHVKSSWDDTKTSLSIPRQTKKERLAKHVRWYILWPLVHFFWWSFHEFIIKRIATSFYDSQLQSSQQQKVMSHARTQTRTLTQNKHHTFKRPILNSFLVGIKRSQAVLWFVYR